VSSYKLLVKSMKKNKMGNNIN